MTENYNIRYLWGGYNIAAVYRPRSCYVFTWYYKRDIIYTWVGILCNDIIM